MVERIYYDSRISSSERCIGTKLSKRTACVLGIKQSQAILMANIGADRLSLVETVDG